MPEYLSPGVYVEEINVGPRPIEGVGTSTAGFLGVTERGPEYPVLVTSWIDYQRWFGGFLPESVSYLPHAVRGFFDNGGQRLFIGRIAHDATSALPGPPPIAATTGASFAQSTAGSLTIRAVGRGTWGNNILWKIDAARSGFQGRFRLTLLYYRTLPDMQTFVDPLDSANAGNPGRRDPDVVEVFDNLVHTPGSSNTVDTVVNSGSRLVRAWFTGPPAQIPTSSYGQLSTTAVDGDPITPTDFEGHNQPIDPSSPRTVELFGRGRGLAALAEIDEIALLAIPDEVRSATAASLSPITTNAINQCEKLKDRFTLVSVPGGQLNIQPIRPPTPTSYAAYYYPWISVYDPLSQQNIRVPPTGHIAGIFARSDIERGVHKAPANEIVRGATELEFPITREAQGILNPRGVNCIRDFRPDRRGIRLWGARTMSDDPMWKYVNVRRLFIYIEESIDEGTQWVVFEPNDYLLWDQVRRTIRNFLVRVWKSGALMGLTEEEAFFVKCDRTTMTQDDIDNGRLICLIGIAPVKPAEFVIFRIFQFTAEANQA